MFTATILAVATAALSASKPAPACPDSDLVPAGSRATSPSPNDIRRVWARFLENQKKKATEKETSGRLATRIEELSTLLKELVDVSDGARKAELEERLFALMEGIRSDLDIAPRPATDSSLSAEVDRIEWLLKQRRWSHHEPERMSKLLANLKDLVVAQRKATDGDHEEKGFEVIFESSRSQTSARADQSDVCSAGPARIKDFGRYFAEMHDLFQQAGQPVPAEVDEALSILALRPRIVAQLLPSLVLDGTASTLQAAAQVHWRTRYMRLNVLGLEWNTDGGIGYGPAVVVLDPSPILKITQLETVTTTTDASGQERQTRTVTSSGSYSCIFATKVENGVSREICDPPKPGAPKLDLQNSLQWHLGLQTGWGIERGGRAGEVRFFGRAQMTNPTASFKVAEDKGAKGSGSTTLASIDGDSRWAFESGLRIAVYDRDRLEARERSGLRPAISLAYGLRWDKRLAGASIANAGANSERRQFLRIALTKVPVFQDNGDFFNLTVGIDREWASSFGRQKNGLPGVTRLFVQANIDFLKALGKDKE